MTFQDDEREIIPRRHVFGVPLKVRVEFHRPDSGGGSGSRKQFGRDRRSGSSSFSVSPNAAKRMPQREQT